MIQRAEHQILLACARVMPNPERQDLIRGALRHDIDWEYLLQTANFHRMISLLFWHLNAAEIDNVPEAMLGRLRAHFLNSAASNLYLNSELFKILDLFTQNKIPSIPFKGPILSHDLYENPALREFGDLDILVKKEDAFKAIGLLPRLGYRRCPEYPRSVASQILSRDYHYQTESREGHKSVELHWSIAPRFLGLPLSIETWWERAKYVTLKEQSVSTLSSEDLLMGLSIHGCRHMWSSLILISDVARLLHKHPTLDWPYILSKYRHPDLMRILLLALMICHDLLHAPVSQGMLRMASHDLLVPKVTSHVKNTIFRRIEEPLAVDCRYFELRMKSRWIDRLLYCYRYISTPTMLEWNMSLPRFLFPLYFFFRLVRIIGSRLRRLVSQQRK